MKTYELDDIELDGKLFVAWGNWLKKNSKSEEVTDADIYSFIETLDFEEEEEPVELNLISDINFGKAKQIIINLE